MNITRIISSFSEDKHIIWKSVVAAILFSLDSIEISEDFIVVKAWNILLKGSSVCLLVDQCPRLFSLVDVSGEDPSVLFFALVLTDLTAVNEDVAFIVGVDDIVMTPRLELEELDEQSAFILFSIELTLAFKGCSIREMEAFAFIPHIILNITLRRVNNKDSIFLVWIRCVVCHDAISALGKVLTN